MQTMTVAENVLSDVITEYGKLKKLGERAVAQLDDQHLFVSLDPESNSIAVLIRHIAGNMRSRWTDFLTSDGEKPDRNRDGEFVLEPATSRETVMSWWESGWACTFAAITALTPEDLSRVVKIRGEDHTVVEALNRQLTHYAAHIGQIVFLAKHLKSAEWQTLSVPKKR
jgi:Protein of unknown function (DUF1572)